MPELPDVVVYIEALERIVHAENETHYCPRCQTGGRLLADRALSRLLKQDWPRTIEELEQIRASRAETSAPRSSPVTSRPPS